MNSAEERKEARRIELKLKNGQKLTDKEWAVYYYSPQGLASSCRCKG